MDTSFSEIGITSYEVLKALINLKHITFEVTDKCNLACKYCIYGDNYDGFGSRFNRNMSFNCAKSVIDYLVDIWENNTSLAEKPEVVISFYGGEPLLNFQLVQQIVDYLESLKTNRSFIYSITSNCLLLNHHMDYIVSKEIHLFCSLDGDSDANKYRVFNDGSSSYEIVYKNIKDLKDKYPDYFSKHVSFNTVLHNLNPVTGVFDYFKKEFNKVPELSEVSDVGFKQGSQSFKSKDFEEQMQKVIHDRPDSNPLRKATEKYIQTNLGNYFTSYVELFHDDTGFSKIPTGTCIPFGNKMFVTVDGLILPCEQIPHSFFFGQVIDGKIQMNYEEIAQKYNAYLETASKRCGFCALKKHCEQCLYKIDGMEKGLPKCKKYISKQKEDISQMAYIKYIYDNPEVYHRALK